MPSTRQQPQLKDRRMSLDSIIFCRRCSIMVLMSTAAGTFSLKLELDEPDRGLACTELAYTLAWDCGPDLATAAVDSGLDAKGVGTSMLAASGTLSTGLCAFCSTFGAAAGAAKGSEVRMGRFSLWLCLCLWRLTTEWKSPAAAVCRLVSGGGEAVASTGGPDLTHSWRISCSAVMRSCSMHKIHEVQAVQSAVPGKLWVMLIMLYCHRCHSCEQH